MLMKRSGPGNSKQSLMTDSGSLPPVTDKSTRSSFFTSSRLFIGLCSKGFSDTEAVMSPTSILDNKTFSGLGSPFWSDKSPKSPDPVSEIIRHPCEKRDSRGIVDALIDQGSEMKSSKPEARVLLFGSQLKIQIPPFSPSLISPADSPRSCIDFDIKKQNSQLGVASSNSFRKSPLQSTSSGHVLHNSPRVITRSLSASEMELSEDYTCVIAHGPNPKMTHIFNNCIVESCDISTSSKESFTPCPFDDFLSFCHTCKKKLGEDKDIFIYRGEKAFCTHECRYQEMLFDDDMEKHEGEEPPTAFYNEIFNNVNILS